MISRCQLYAAKLSVGQVDRLVAAGALIVVHRGVYRLAGAPASIDGRVMAACLATGGVASHRCAAALWELRGCEPGPVEITVVGRRRAQLKGIVAHSTARLAKVDSVERREIPVTSPGRTLLDLGSVAEDAVESALEDALHRGLVSESWLRRVLRRAGGPGRDGTATLRALLAERAPGQRATESDLEDDLVRVLRRAGLPAPVRQYKIGSVRIDLCYPDARLALEAQSMKWHAGRADLQRDCDKHNAVVNLGWRLLVFTWHDVHRRPEWVASVVRDALASAGLPHRTITQSAHASNTRA